MNISSIRNKNNNRGFTLIELIIVIGGLAALGSFTFPNILTTLKLNDTLKKYLFYDSKCPFWNN